MKQRSLLSVVSLLMLPLLSLSACEDKKDQTVQSEVAQSAVEVPQSVVEPTADLPEFENEFAYPSDEWADGYHTAWSIADAEAVYPGRHFLIAHLANGMIAGYDIRGDEPQKVWEAKIADLPNLGGFAGYQGDFAVFRGAILDGKTGESKQTPWNIAAEELHHYNLYVTDEYSYYCPEQPVHQGEAIRDYPLQESESCELYDPDGTLRYRHSPAVDPETGRVGLFLYHDRRTGENKKLEVPEGYKPAYDDFRRVLTPDRGVDYLSDLLFKDGKYYVAFWNLDGEFLEAVEYDNEYLMQYSQNNPLGLQVSFLPADKRRQAFTDILTGKSPNEVFDGHLVPMNRHEDGSSGVKTVDGKLVTLPEPFIRAQLGVYLPSHHGRVIVGYSFDGANPWSLLGMYIVDANKVVRFTDEAHLGGDQARRTVLVRPDLIVHYSYADRAINGIVPGK